MVDASEERDATIKKIVEVCRQQASLMTARREIVDLMRENEKDRAEASKPYAEIEVKLLGLLSVCDHTIADAKAAFQVHTDKLVSMPPSA